MVARGSHRDVRNLIRVLKATPKGPWRDSQRPTRRRPRRARQQRRQRATRPIFSPERAARQGDRRLEAWGTRIDKMLSL
jgi:hypothetical protein